MILPPEHCDTMADLRGQIDRIDRALLDLLAERARYIDSAIVLKPRDNLPARTTDRVAQVIATVCKGAEDRKIERIWTDLIQTAIAHEAKMLGERQR
ncbi:MAG: chorismate mutase [Paracoccaceae bacterium]